MSTVERMWLRSAFLLFGLVTFCCLLGCENRSKGTSNNSNSSSSIGTTSFASSLRSSAKSSSSLSVADRVILSGVITYDYVPHGIDNIGLDYASIQKRAVRGATLELLNASGVILASTATASDGSYSFFVAKNTVVKVRVRAELSRSIPPTWNFRVTDNTANNAVYALDGTAMNVGIENSQRNLHAPSGWDGSAYTSTRSSAPFAILDNLYLATDRLLAAGNTRNLPPIELRWSTKNSTAEGDYTKGEVGTSFYDGTAIYILGDANNDTDEFDGNVILHEWSHYLEESLFRSDSIGGIHKDGDFLDFRVAMSEGFANAFSGMLLNNVNYSDASGSAQKLGSSFNLAKRNRVNKGYFSEGSIGSVFYNYYSSGDGKTANDFSLLFKVMGSPNYYANDAMVSIYLFYAQLKSQFSDQAPAFNNLLQEQNIVGGDEYGIGETNSGGLAFSLPIYKEIQANNVPVNVCSSADKGKQNKLGNAQFLRLPLMQAGNYSLVVTKSGAATTIGRPEIFLYQKGEVVGHAANEVNNRTTLNASLSQGTYVIEVFDESNRDEKNFENNTFCFDVRVTAN